MKKKILIGSMLVLVLILLMPSIPAIQTNAVQEGIKQDLQEKLESITLDDLKDIEGLDDLKHSLLYRFVDFIFKFRIIRGLIYYILVFENFLYFDVIYGVEIIYPILALISLLRFYWLFETALIWHDLWFIIADIGGWNWK